MDPYAILTVRSQEKKSSVASGKGTEPEWNETFLFSVSEGVEELLIKLLDSDTGTNDDLVGEVSVPLEALFAEGSIPVTAYSVVKDQEYKGELRLGLNFTPEDTRERGFGEDESYGGWKQSSF
uniref:C2 domain-containing protein n=1 Tax=Kalanchoe fedtschenkoi TaxID=63787 RepID=A0A7N0UR87_KALFE